VGKNVVDKRRFKRVINSYVLAQDDPGKNLELLKKYLKKKGIADVSIDILKREISSQIKNKRKKKKMSKIETRLFKKEDEEKSYRYGSAFCGNCYMFKDYEKECPYCGKLEMTR